MHIFNCSQAKSFGWSHIFALKVWDYLSKHTRSPEGTLTTISVLLKNYLRMSGPSLMVNLRFGQHFSLTFKMDFALLCNCSIIWDNIYFLFFIFILSGPNFGI